MTNQELLNNIKQYPWGEGGLKWFSQKDGFTQICFGISISQEDGSLYIKGEDKMNRSVSYYELRPILYPMPEFKDLLLNGAWANKPIEHTIQRDYENGYYNLLPQYLFQWFKDNKYNIFNIPEIVDANTGKYYE